MWKLKWKMSKEKWVMLMLIGAALLLLAAPVGSPAASASPKDEKGESEISAKDSLAASGAAKASLGEGAYEAMLEKRVKEILRHVDGVGEVDVMIVLKSSEEKVLHVDRSSKNSESEEKDSAGGTRVTSEGEYQESAVLAGGAGDGGPIIEKELCPEISGIVISASGGGSPAVQAEISSAMEALFGLPPHKIKILKRAA